MKINIKDIESEQRKDCKLETIKKCKKVLDLEFSEAKKIAINRVVTDATNQRAALAPSTSKDLFSHFTNPQKAFTPLSSVSASATCKDSVLRGNTSKCDQNFVFGQQSHFQSATDAHSTQRNSNDFSNKQQSSTIVRQMENRLIPDAMDSLQTVAGAQSVKENTINLNGALNNIWPSTVASSSMQNSMIHYTMNSPQTVDGAQTIKVNSMLSPSVASPAMENSLIPHTMSSPQNVTQPMEKRIVNFNDSLYNTLASAIMSPSVQKMLVSHVKKSFQSIVSAQLTKDNTVNQNDSLNKIQSSTIVSSSIQNTLVPNVIKSPQSVSGAQPTKVNTVNLNDSLNKILSSTIVSPLTQNALVPNVMKSQQSTAGAQLTKDNTVNQNDSLNKIQSSTIVSSSIQNTLVPNVIKSPQSVSGAQPTKVNTVNLNDSLNKILSSTIVSPLTQNALVPNVMKSQQSTAGAQPMKDNTVNQNDSLNKIQRTIVSSSIQNTLVPNVIKSPQSVSGAQPTKVNTVNLNDSLNKILSSTIVSPLTRNALVPNAMKSQQSIAGAQAMKENILNLNDSVQSTAGVEPVDQQGTFDDLLQIHKPLNTTKSTMQNNSCEKNMQASKPHVQSKWENINSNKSSNTQQNSVHVPPPAVQNSYNNSLMTQKCSLTTQTIASNATSNVTIGDKKSQHSQNTPTKGVKRKVEELENKVKTRGKKKNKKKPTFIQPQIPKKLKKSNMSRNNFPAMQTTNSLMYAIVEEQYPNMPPLTDVHLTIVRNVIKEKIDKIPFGAFVPKFMHSFIKNGVILVECVDNNSKEWLKHAITNYNPEEGIYLKVIPAETIDQYYPASIFVHDEVNAIDVLRRLQKQNSDISIRNWQYQSMTVVKESAPGITINVGIPATSVVQLKEKNFKLFHALDQVSVIMKVQVPF